MKGFIKVLANHVCGIVCAVGTVCGIPFFYNLISGFDMNTDIARALVTVVGVLLSGVSFALGWNQRNMSVRREISEVESGHVDALKEKEVTIAGKQAALDNERRKNAKLAARWERLNSEERRKRETFDVLSEREKWCLSHVVDDWPKKHSVSGSVILASYDVLTRAGILIDQGENELHGQMAHTYTISLEWRKWVFNHSNELPEPDLKMPE